MTHANIQHRLIIRLEDVLATKIVQVDAPPQGMSSHVFFITTDVGIEYAVKYGQAAFKEIAPLQLIARGDATIPIPALIAWFELEEIQVVVMSKIKFPLLESVSVAQMGSYVPSMIRSLRGIHANVSNRPGSLGYARSSWKEVLYAIFSGENFDWNEISKRPGLDTHLVLSSVAQILELIQAKEFDEGAYSLLHTDYNQRNLFVNPLTNEIIGIIDWEEAMYGDPIYDMARVRMYLWHFNLGNQVIDDYYQLVQFTPHQKRLEALYWLTRVIQYLAWYSAERTEFNLARISLHQEFLRTYDWNLVT